MKLLYCNIENFGKLSNFSYNFNDGLNTILQDNGFGKTTLAYFIKAMFYGLEVTSKRSLNENIRKKYQPWQVGNYGGSLAFSINDKEYKITRFFGSKESEDTFELISLKTGKISNDYTKNIGEEIFQIDSDGYERSTFIPQNLSKTGKRESLANKLVNLIQGTDVSYSVDDALKIIDGRRAELKRQNKLGLIDVTENEITRLTNEINELKTKRQSISILKEYVDKEDKEIIKLQSLKEQVDIKIKKCNEIQTKLAYVDNVKEKQKICDNYSSEIKKYNSILNNSEISTSTIDEYVDLLEKINEKNGEIKSKNTFESEQKLNQVINYFGGDKSKIPSREELYYYEQKNYEYNKTKSEVDIIPTKNESNKNSSKKSLFLLIPSIILIILGCITITSNLIISIISFIASVLFILFFAFTYFSKMIDEKTSQKSGDNQSILLSKNALILSLEKELNSFISKYESSAVNFTLGLNAIIKNIDLYNTLSGEISRKEKELEILNSQVAELNLKLKGFLSNFNFDIYLNNDRDKLYYLKQTVNNLIRVKEQYKNALIELENIKKEKNFNVDEKELETLDFDVLQRDSKNYQEQIDKEKEIKYKHLQNISKIQDETYVLVDLESEKDELTVKLKEYQEELAIIKSAEKFLKNASEELTSRFLNPIKDSFKKYIKIVTGNNFDNVEFNTDLDISLIEYGVSREVNYLSEGYKSIIDLCMRFSLIECIFENEKPFIILDDPFVNLDGEKLQNAIKLLNNVAKEYQIVYFTCHESRA